MRDREETRPQQNRQARGGIVCAGNFIVDRVHTLTYWPEQGNLAHIVHQDIGVGGGAANVVTDLASLGFPGKLAAAGCVGADADGAYVRNRLTSVGIDCASLTALDTHATAHTHVMNVPGKSRTFFYHGGANDALDETAIDVATLAAAGYCMLYLGYLMLLPGLDRADDGGGSGAALLLQAAKKAGLTTCVDFVSSEDLDFAERIAPILPFCDYVVINEIEAGRATETVVRDTDGTLVEAKVAAAGKRLISGGVARAAIVHAPEMCFWFAPDAEPVVARSCPVDETAIVSPVGAGDAFCAAVLYGLHEGWPVERICALAHRSALHCLGGATATDSIPPMSALMAELDVDAR